MLQLIEEKIKDLTETERKFIVAMDSGETEFTPESPLDIVFSTEHPLDIKFENRCSENTIRGKVLRLVYMHAGIGKFPSAPRINCAYISDNLDLENLTINSPIRFKLCEFEKVINFSDSIVKKGIFLPGSKTPGILGERVTVKGPVILRHGFKSEGTINFHGAKIESDVDLCGATCIRSGKKECLDLSSAIVRGNLLLSLGYKIPFEEDVKIDKKPSTFTGIIRITNSRIFGNLECSYSTFERGVEIPSEMRAKYSHAIDLYNSIIDGDLFIDHAIICGGVSIWGATIQGDAHFNGSTFKKHNAESSTGQTSSPTTGDHGNKSTPSNNEQTNEIHDISADGLVVKGAIYLHNIAFDPKDKKYYFSFNHSQAETIADDMASWPQSIDIDGFHYRTISKDPSRMQRVDGNQD